MSEESSLLGTRMAAEIAGCSARHIQSLIKKGRLSASRDDSGNYLIDKSEFYRVFPDAHTKRIVTHNDEFGSRTALEVEVKYLKEMLTEKANQNEFLHKQLEAANTEKSALIETITSNQKLLEHTNQRKRKKFLGIF
jgi:DNA-binding transcriptional MerR regulator